MLGGGWYAPPPLGCYHQHTLPEKVCQVKRWGLVRILLRVNRFSVYKVRVTNLYEEGMPAPESRNFFGRGWMPGFWRGRG